MTNSIFDNTPSQESLFGNNSDTAASQPSFDIEGIMQTLMAQTGCSAQEAADAVARQMAKQKAPANSPLLDIPYSQLRTDAERSEYMRQLNSETANSFNNPWVQEIASSDTRVAAAQAQFMQNMKAKATNTNAHVIEKMRKLREGE